MKKELVYLYGQEELDAIKYLQTQDVLAQRIAFMNNRVGRANLGMSSRKFSVQKTWWNEGTYYYAFDMYTLFMSASGKLFTRNVNQAGMSYIPEDKHTVKLWGKTKLSDLPTEIVYAMLKSVGAEWTLEKQPDASQYAYPMLHRMIMNKGLFQRILKGRITNGEDLVRAWLKVDTRWRELKISHRAKTVLTLIRRDELDMNELIDFLSIVNNVEATLDMLLQGKKLRQHVNLSRNRVADFEWFYLNENIRRDMCKELIILDRKINSTWSAKRLSAMHTEMSRELLDLEVATMERIDHGYATPCPVLPGMELIDNNIRLYAEGREMSHCIYSYLDRAQRRDVVHFHCTFGETPFSLAVEYSNYHNTWVLQQMFGKFNSNCTEDQRAIVGHWLYEEPVQQWLTNERDLVRSNGNVEDYDPLPF